MEIGAIDTSVFTGSLRPIASVGGPSFESLLREGLSPVPAPGAAPSKGKPDKVREAAEEFVSMALVEPILAKMRSMNMAAEPFAPGAHEKAFAPFVDKAWSKNLVKAGGWDLVERVEQWMRQRADVKPMEVRNG